MKRSAKALDDVQNAEILAVLVRVGLPAGRDQDALDAAERLQIGGCDLLEGLTTPASQIDRVDPHGKIALQRVDVDGPTVRAPAGEDFVWPGARHWPRFAALHREEHQAPLRALGGDELAVG